MYLNICVGARARACVCVCVCVALSVCLSVCIYVYPFVHLSVCLSVCMHVCILCMYVCEYVRVCLSVCLSVSMYVWTSMCPSSGAIIWRRSLPVISEPGVVNNSCWNVPVYLMKRSLLIFAQIQLVLSFARFVSLPSAVNFVYQLTNDESLW